MKTLYKILFVALITALMAGCGMQGNPSGNSGGTGAATPGATASGDDLLAATPEEGVTVTLDDNGKTITMKQGQTLLLKLGEEYTWDISISDMAVLSRVKNVMVIRGAQGLYDTPFVGQSDITATGNPTCLSEKPACAQPSIEFKVTVNVTR